MDPLRYAPETCSGRDVGEWTPAALWSRYSEKQQRFLAIVWLRRNQDNRQPLKILQLSFFSFYVIDPDM